MYVFCKLVRNFVCCPIRAVSMRIRVPSIQSDSGAHSQHCFLQNRRSYVY